MSREVEGGSPTCREPRRSIMPAGAIPSRSRWRMIALFVKKNRRLLLE
jgi:hypothetical protein